MRAVVTLLIVSGCNQVFGLEQAVPWDGPPVDAPPQCPPLGTAPKFSGVTVQVIARNCFDYSLSATADFAIAGCFDSSMIEGGRIDMPLSPIGLGNPLAYSWPRLSPEGDQVFARVMSTPETLAVFRRSSTTWVRGPDIFTSTAINGSSAPTRGTGNRRIVVLTSGQSNLLELEETSGMWTVRGAPYVPNDLGGSTFGLPFLSDDGLRLLFMSTANTTRAMLYADRDSVDQRFRAVGEITGVPLSGSYAHMTPDCARIYASQTSTIVYTPQ